jgi:hypothetical protein
MMLWYDAQISKPNEFDCMITCEIRCEKIYYPPKGAIPANCCTLRLISGDNLWEPHEVLTRDADGNQYVCPKAFMAWFRKQVTDVVRHAKDHHRVLKKEKVGETQAIIFLVLI